MDLISGGLIQMNAHMVIKPEADAVMFIGAIVAILSSLCIIAAIIRHVNKKAAIAFAVLAVFGVALYFSGRAVPKVKEIHACANGPVSLEQVATVYDIVKIDGKELILRER